MRQDLRLAPGPVHTRTTPPLTLFVRASSAGSATASSSFTCTGRGVGPRRLQLGKLGSFCLYLACQFKVQGPPSLHSGKALGRCAPASPLYGPAQPTSGPADHNHPHKKSITPTACLHPRSVHHLLQRSFKRHQLKGQLLRVVWVHAACRRWQERQASGRLCRKQNKRRPRCTQSWLIDVKSPPSRPAAPCQAGVDSAPAEPCSPLLTGVVIFKVGRAPRVWSSLAADADGARVRRLLPHPLVNALFQHIHKPVAARGGNGERQVGGACPNPRWGQGRSRCWEAFRLQQGRQEVTTSHVEQRACSAHLSGLCS